ncbi:MAG: hypothetical protein KJ808_02780 [Acidobacteria bacterium]|nr:hypothetical protein [Acidobacteriota bacterium]MBU4307161.1 hypothetical protein [Acidobacteriota bacterium]MBU4405453.1 hypothetical protein [Acidobacteriota bacterium]MCG2812683.1 hypothetical protein [Candidatus Aminicenantes bacterium]
MFESNSKPLSGLGKSVILGGGASGILSIFPGLNLLNLFFMLWIALGAGLTIYLLCKENKQLRRSDSMLAGALSGLTGGGIFAILSLVNIIGVSQERFEQMVEKARSLAPFLREDSLSSMASSQFKTMMIIGVVFFVLASIIAGAVAGLIARKIFHHPSGSTHE